MKLCVYLRCLAFKERGDSPEHMRSDLIVCMAYMFANMEMCLHRPCWNELDALALNKPEAEG